MILSRISTPNRVVNPISSPPSAAFHLPYRRRYGVELIECFPKTVAAQALTAPQATEVQKLQVTFSYRYWKNLTDESQLPKPLRERIEEVVINSAERQIRAAIPRVLSRL